MKVKIDQSTDTSDLQDHFYSLDFRSFRPILRRSQGDIPEGVNKLANFYENHILSVLNSFKFKLFEYYLLTSIILLFCFSVYLLMNNRNFIFGVCLFLFIFSNYLIFDLRRVQLKKLLAFLIKTMKDSKNKLKVEGYDMHIGFFYGAVNETENIISSKLFIKMEFFQIFSSLEEVKINNTSKKRNRITNYNLDSSWSSFLKLYNFLGIQRTENQNNVLLFYPKVYKFKSANRTIIYNIDKKYNLTF